MNRVDSSETPAFFAGVSDELPFFQNGNSGVSHVSSVSSSVIVPFETFELTPCDITPLLVLTQDSSRDEDVVMGDSGDSQGAIVKSSSVEVGQSSSGLHHVFYLFLVHSFTISLGALVHWAKDLPKGLLWDNFNLSLATGELYH